MSEKTTPAFNFNKTLGRPEDEAAPHLPMNPNAIQHSESDDPALALVQAEHRWSNMEKTLHAETATSRNIAACFERNADFVQPGIVEGSRHLTLYMPYRDTLIATVEVYQQPEAADTMVTYLSFEAKQGWPNYMRLVEKEGYPPRFQKCKKDEGGNLVPIPEAETGYDGTPRQDRANLGFDAQFWPENLKVATPQKPKGIFAKRIGKWASSHF